MNDFLIFPTILEIQDFLKKMDNIYFSIQTLENEPYNLKFKFNTDNIEEASYFTIFPTEKSDYTKNYVKEVQNGPIFNLKNYNLLYWNGSFEYDGLAIPDDGLYIQGKTQKSISNSDKTHYILMKYKEGSLIKLYYDETEKSWKIGTSKSLDAFKVYHLSQKTFGEYFNEFCKKDPFFYENLDTNYSYSYLIKIQNINTVFDNSTNSLELISKFKKNTAELEYNYKQSIEFKYEPIKNYLFQWASNKNDLLKENFLLIQKPIGDSNDNKIEKIKIINPEYSFYSELLHKTKCKSALNRFIELRAEPEKMVMISSLSQYLHKTYSYFKTMYHDLLAYLHKLYIDSHVKKIKLDKNQFDEEEYKLIKMLLWEIHNYHKQNKVSIKLFDVYKISLNQDLNGKLIRLFSYFTEKTD
jgi:hypothetical protein